MNQAKTKKYQRPWKEMIFTFSSLCHILWKKKKKVDQMILISNSLDHFLNN